MLAPSLPLRAAATAYGRDAADEPIARDEIAAPSTAQARNARSPPRCLWAMLLARLFESLPLVCPNCGADGRIIAFVTEAAPVERILTHIEAPSFASGCPCLRTALLGRGSRAGAGLGQSQTV